MLAPWTNFSYGTDPLVNQNPIVDITDVPGVYDVRFTVRNG